MACCLTRRHVPTPNTSCRSQGWGSRGICGDQCWFDLPLEATKLPTRNTQIRPDKTQPHWRSKQMYDFQTKAEAKFNEYCGTLGPHDEVYTDGSKIDERVGAAAVINRHFQNCEIICRCLSKRLLDNSTIFAAEATAITLALDYYQHMEPVRHDVVYSDSMSCLQAIEWEDTENPLICYIMNLLWLLSDKGTHVRFCWIPSHCGIKGNEKNDQSAKESLDPLARVHYADLKPLINSYIQQLLQIK